MNFDAYEIHPIALSYFYGKTFRDEASDPSMADFWSLYGHRPDGELERLADCASRTAAEHLLERLQLLLDLTAGMQHGGVSFLSGPAFPR